MVQEIECCEEVLQVLQVRVRGIQEIHVEVFRVHIHDDKRSIFGDLYVSSEA